MCLGERTANVQIRTTDAPNDTGFTRMLQRPCMRTDRLSEPPLSTSVVHLGGLLDHAMAMLASTCTGAVLTAFSKRLMDQFLRSYFSKNTVSKSVISDVLPLLPSFRASGSSVLNQWPG